VSSWKLLRALPGEILAVQLAVSEAAVKDANETVSEGAESLAVGAKSFRDVQHRAASEFIARLGGVPSKVQPG
jgi:hypothetical protein